MHTTFDQQKRYDTLEENISQFLDSLPPPTHPQMLANSNILMTLAKKVQKSLEKC